MRKLLVVRGPQGAGKSTTIREIGLERHVVSPDRTRQLLASPYLSMEGHFTISQHLNAKVWAMTNEILEERMNSMETIAFDATLPEQEDVERILAMARKHRYDVRVLDFYSMPEEQVRAQNAAREPYLRVSDAVIDDVYARVSAVHDPRARTIPWQADGAHRREVQDWLRIPTLDLSPFQSVVFVGDVQGCLTPLRDPASPFADGIDSSVAYVFCGDFFDRGIENGEVARWILKQVGRPNVFIVRGNHEYHLERWVDGLEPVSMEFMERTLPQLESAGIGPDEVRPLVDALHEALPIHWRGRDVLVTHGGLSGWPKDLHLVPGEQFEAGTGSYEQPVDVAFDAWAASEERRRMEIDGKAPASLMQVHGHRNALMLPLARGDDQRSWNLEGQVEFGGHLRMIRLDEAGIHPIEIRNPRFRPHAEVVAETLARGHKPHGRRIPVPPWHDRGEVGRTKIGSETLKALRKHALINERVSAVMEHVSAFNFSHDAFREGKWDEHSLAARGLFIDTESGSIVARGYEKFFNVGERPETKIDVLMATVSYPVVGYRKENGFLGITGYDEKTGNLVVASKSMLDSPFAGWFRTILEQRLGPAGMERLHRINRDLEASCVFEVIDVENDPHIIKYERNDVILLDVIRRSEAFERLAYDELEQVGNLLGCRVKERSMTLPNAIALEQKIKAIERPDFTIGDRDRDGNLVRVPVEGFVMEDADGRMFKVKSGYYAEWKRARSAKDRLLKNRLDGRPFNPTRYADNPTLQAFVGFCQRQPTEVLERDIIVLRDAFMADPERVLEGRNEGRDRDAEARAKVLRGFEVGARAVGRQVAAGTAKDETVEKMIAGAADDADKIAILRSIPEFDQRMGRTPGTGMSR